MVLPLNAEPREITKRRLTVTHLTEDSSEFPIALTP